ncbi:MAG: PQQ-like beta-propeller repeat protein [Planctomycetes bacterium]|nr:PQQ-like beta-propeller repeat protein [Planctomycetota bacterium]
MTHKTRDRACILSLGLCIVTTLAHAEDWPNWRGPRYDGSSNETNFKKSWTDDLKKLWDLPIGSAYSGISVVGNRAYTCGIEKDKQTLFCIDVNNGKIIWKSPIEDNFKNEWGNGSRGTPTVNDSRVYIMGANGTVCCFEAADGKKVWSREFSNRPMWGYSSSVLIHDDLAIITPGGKDGAVRALKKSTGREAWHCGDDDSPGYSTPYPFSFDGRDYVVSFLGTGAIIADIKTGKEVARIPWKTDWNVNAATPIYHKGYLWLGSGYRTGCGVFKLSKAGDQIDAEEVWKSSVMLNKFQTPVLHDGKLYAFDERAFKCVDFKTGKLEWRERGENGTIILADGQLITLTEKGRLRIGKAPESGFTPTGEADILDDRCWTVPTLSNGKLYARNLERVVCYDLSE